MEAAMPRVMRGSKNSELLDKFGMVNEPTSVLDCHAALRGGEKKKRRSFCATALIKNG